MDQQGDGCDISAIWIHDFTYCGDFLDGHSQLENITIITEARSENCFNVIISIDSQAQEVSLHLGHCAGAEQYSNEESYTQECCPEMGDYKLACSDAEGDGQPNTTITIDGVAYSGGFLNRYIHPDDIIIYTITVEASTLNSTTNPTLVPAQLPTLYPSD